MVFPLLALVTAGQLVVGTPAAMSSAQAAKEPDKRGDAYYEFLRGRHLEGEGDVEAAVDAYKRAVALDPVSAEIQAELAALYARQNQAEQAIKSAEAALQADPENSEAHWVLGTVYAALAQGTSDGAPVVGDALDQAVGHLEKARAGRRYDLGLALALGRLYLQKGEHSKAIEQLKWLVDQEPGAAEVAFLLAQGYEGAGQREAALETLRRVVEVEPRYFRAWVTLADLLEKERKFEEAAAAYGKAVSQNPKSVELRLRQATVMMNAGQVVGARQLLRQVVQESPTEGGALYLLSEAHRQLNEFEEAEATAKRLVALEPGQLRGPFALALVYEGTREYRKVIDTLEPAVSKAGAQSGGTRLAPVLVRLALAYQEIGSYDRAISTFEQARSASPGDLLLDAYLAQALIQAGKLSRALEVAAEIRKQRPDDYRFARIEADALAKSGKVDAAVALLQEQVTRFGQRPDVHLGLASLCVEQRRYDCAKGALDRAEQQFPDNLQVTFQRAAMHERQEQYAEAEKAFRAVLARDPLHGPTLNYLGYMLAERGERLDEAVALLKRALDTDPWNGSYLDSLGWAYYVRGELNEARKYLALAAERLPLNSVVQDHFGDALWKAGEREKAIAAWERALQGDREAIDATVIARKLDDAKRARP